ncbi:MAG: T9SS C-terminal target domain-containing protein [Ignavibacteriae bacterium]|nr:MAG: T9SS C-terminal target domain-containing protein [Ignavibacteriota bacterium]
MIKSYIILVITFFAIHTSFAQTYQWVKHNSHSISFNPDFASFPSAADGSGNVITGTIHNFKLVYGTAFYGDIIFRKYNSTGNEVLSKILTGKAIIKNIDCDANGNIYMFGSFMDTLRIDASNFIVNTGSGFDLNDYLIKFNSSGNVLWKKNITALYSNNASVSVIKIKGNILLAGIVTYNFQGMIKKFDLNGNEQLSVIFNPVRTLSGLDIDGSGNIFAAGSCGTGNVNFAGLNVNCSYVYSLYFAKLNSSGTGIWAKLVEDVTFENPSVVCDNSGNVYGCGDLYDNFLFGTIQTQGPDWVYDFYLTKIDASGTFLWVKEVPNSSGFPSGDAAVGKATKLIIDAQNNLYITGFQRGTIDWDENITTTSAGSYDVLVLKYNSNGTLLWGKTAGGTSVERGDAISLDNSNNIFVTGNFNQSSVFDTIIVTGSGQINSFTAKLSNPAITGVSNQNSTPFSYFLNNYPNPFNPKTIISYQLAINSDVKLTVFDITGREIAVLVNQNQNAGKYSIEWNAGNVTSGIYFCKIESENFTQTNKMILLK